MSSTINNSQINPELDDINPGYLCYGCMLCMCAGILVLIHLESIWEVNIHEPD